jgi:hypothetical protein
MFCALLNLHFIQLHKQMAIEIASNYNLEARAQDATVNIAKLPNERAQVPAITLSEAVRDEQKYFDTIRAAEGALVFDDVADNVNISNILKHHKGQFKMVWQVCWWWWERVLFIYLFYFIFTKNNNIVC